MHKTLEVVKERARALYSKELSFICGAKNKLNRYRKRIGYKSKLKMAEKYKLSFYVLIMQL